MEKKTRPNKAISPKPIRFKKGDRVMYLDKRDGARKEVIIHAINNNVGPGEEPDISILMDNGKIRDTVMGRLKPVQDGG